MRWLRVQFLFQAMFQVSSAVEQWPVKPLVVGSNPTLGDQTGDKL